tara:strand:- start:86 stop:928 length:843 start_codon:yes stop_codon:yes gene_type:complete
MVMTKYEKFPIALTGCRTTNITLDCCEYDFVILSDTNIHELLHIDDNYVKIRNIKTKQDIHSLAPLLQNMEIINDPVWTLVTLKQNVTTVMSKALSLYAKNAAVDALFYANRSRGVAKNNTLLSSLWLKCAAYYYLEAVIAKNGSIPMPTHMLTQLRSINEDTYNHGIINANTCLGLERANRSSISRSTKAVIGLKEIVKNHTEIVVKKVQFLLCSSMYTDCYFYLGYITRNIVIGTAFKQRIMKDYIFIINIAMDLTTDQSFLSEFSNEFVNICSTLLR